MLLSLPNLDDRRWADLVEEGRSLIPLYAPEWTDHNIHDPGITLVELFAWLAEMDIFRVNQIPERYRWKFLALVGIQPMTPAPARTVLRFQLKPAQAPAIEPAPVLLPADIECLSIDPFGHPVPFRTRHPLTVTAMDLKAILVQDAGGWHDQTERWRRDEAIQPFGPDPRPGAALYLGFAASLPTGAPVTIFFVASDLGADEAERARLLDEAQHRDDGCRAPSALITCGEGLPALPPNGEACGCQSHDAMMIAWEYLAADGKWRRVPGAAVSDQTRAFTLSGATAIHIPEAMQPIALGHLSDQFFYLRCRFVAGTYDAPPMLRALIPNGAEAEQAATVGNVTWAIVPGAAIAGAPVIGLRTQIGLRFNGDGSIDRLIFNDPASPAFRVLAYVAPAAGAAGRLSIEAEEHGWGAGAAGQYLSLAHFPLLERDFHLYTLEGDQWQQWAVRADFDASRRDDNHITLDAGRGIVVFGDGNAGRVAPSDARIIVVSAATEAGDGNLPAHVAAPLADNPHNRALLSQVDPATHQTAYDSAIQGLAAVRTAIAAMGGATAETIDRAEGRAATVMAQVTRVVTLADYATVAMQTPGVHLARASVLANFYPGFETVHAPGIVSVIVLPSLPRGRPMPSTALKRAVARHLNMHRIIGTRITVIGPTYLEIRVQATVQPRAHVRKTDLQQAVTDRLNAFFDPLAGGPDGTGWPLGRAVYRAEVLQQLAETTGVDHVVSLALLSGASDDPQCANICLGATGLVAAGTHQIEVV